MGEAPGADRGQGLLTVAQADNLAIQFEISVSSRNGPLLYVYCLSSIENDKVDIGFAAVFLSECPNVENRTCSLRETSSPWPGHLLFGDRLAKFGDDARGG